MPLNTTSDLLSLSTGNTVRKDDLNELIQYSKVEGNPHWSGSENVIGNTPQQGINWIGTLPRLQAVLIRVWAGAYEHDGWVDEEKTLYRYSFKTREGVVSYHETANSVLTKQQQHEYPVLLLTEQGNSWRVEGYFSVVEIQDRFVILRRTSDVLVRGPVSQEELQFQEGGIKYVTHLMAERNRDVVKALKEAVLWVCDVCDLNFETKYGVKYIEAHHKIPLATYSINHIVNTSDFVLLCPNCHKAVHICMKELPNPDYPEIKTRLKSKLRI